MINAVEELVKILEGKNIEWEIYWEESRSTSFKIEKGKIERVQQKFSAGIGLRVGVGGKQGFSYITGLEHDRKTLEEFVKRTVKLARVGEVEFVGLPTPKGVPRVKGLYDPQIARLGFEEGHEMAEAFVEGMAGKDATFSGSLGYGVGRDGIVNSNGVELEWEGTAFTLHAYAVRKDGRTGTGSEYKALRELPGEEVFDEVIEKALWELELSYQAGRLDSYEGEIIFEPHALASILDVLLPNLHANTVYHGRSRFRETDVEVASEVFTLLDDATLPGGVASYPFDGEGNPGQRTVLIEGGILRSFLYDERYARLMNAESTGNAVRDFRTAPSIGTSNVVVRGKGENLEDLDRAIVVRKVYGEHTANPVSGDFSLTIELGYVVKGGEVRPFKDNMLAGNIFEFLKDIGAVGRKVEVIGSFVSPRVLSRARIV
ncbi:TldD/PmbA family protein [Pyrococcus yayanosii]|uniref:Zinc-dependent protease n=1 Tax=Pyrococcus yayanosii (strain CH1 / JCM 16557) TaxID=529709 RepID=F8AIF8_PYRYC|nr:TldD/PmbA family protein [Pyrococcus yayanosii]AEH25569.1 zinc-dependent protease [Pyrococcus yayanosii CH1]